MRATDFLTEGTAHPCIVVDVQPEYIYYDTRSAMPVAKRVVDFVANKQTGRVLMYVNAEDTGVSADSIPVIKNFWESLAAGSTPGYGEYEIDDEYDDHQEPTVDWSRFQIIDKGYGYLRSWMDSEVPESTIVRTIREMYAQRVPSSTMLFGGEDSVEYEESMTAFLGNDLQDWMLTDPIHTNWISILPLRAFNGAYIMGGGRNECLREVELLMNAFNIRYKRIESMVY